MVPNGWSKLSLKKLLTLNYGKSPKEIIDENGAYDIVGTGGITGSTNKYLHSEPSVIIGRKGTIDKPQYLDKPFWAIDTTFYCVPIDKNKVDIKWFYQYSKLINWRNYNEASGVPSLSRETIYAIQVATPPITEQREIVKILATWDKAISTTERLIENSTQQKKAVMQQLLTGKKRLLDESGKRFEGDWERLKLEDIVIRTQLGTSERTKDIEETRTIPLIKMGNLTWGGFSFDKLETLPKSKVDDSLILKNGDFLFNTRNTPELVGKSAIWKEQQVEATFDNNINRITFNQNIDTDFMCLYLTYGKGKSLISSLSAGSTSVAAIYWKDLKNIKLPVPTLSEQQKIATVLTNADKEIELLEQQLADLQQEKKALMQVLLTGKVRVRVDGAV